MKKENEDPGALYNNSLRDTELFKDENNIKYPVISVKRKTSNKNGESWEILSNGKMELKFTADKFTNKQKEFLRSADGFNYLITGFKQGWNSVNRFKSGIKV